jgi:hypothetical protein
MKHSMKYCVTIVVLMLLWCNVAQAQDYVRDRIQPWSENPRFWQYKGDPVLLIGGSDEDNLFNNPQLMRKNLKRLQEIGGNYIRLTLSCRDEGDEWPFRKEGELYNLDKLNPKFFNRLENCLKMAWEMDIIVQIELWATFDFYMDYWPANAWNPLNNKSLTTENTRLKTAWADHPARNVQPFFYAPPMLHNDKLVLKYQRKFINRVMSIALKYPNVLYCGDNETNTTYAWTTFWMHYIKRLADKAGKKIETTQMFDGHYEDIEYIMSKPEMFTFVECNKLFAPQKWSTQGEAQWHKTLEIMDSMGEQSRPMTIVKLRGTSNNMPGDETIESVKKYWRGLLAGYSALRFHRPVSLGLSKPAQASILAIRKLENNVKFWDLQPRLNLLKNREEDEAYLRADPGFAYVMYYTDGGAVGLDLSKYSGSNFALRWVDIATGQWAGSENIAGGSVVGIAAPDAGGWAAVITKR